MKSLHTPGPWIISWNTFNRGEAHGIYKDGELDLKGYQVATVNIWPTIDQPGEESGKANALLIAAAPDMLEALINTRNYLMDILIGENYSALFERLNNAILKATKIH